MTRDLKMAYAGTSPWAKSGVEVPPGTLPKAMLASAGLDWKVAKRPMYVAGAYAKPDSNLHVVVKVQQEDGSTEVRRPLVEVPGKYALVRDTDDHILSTVGSGYKPLQNEEAVDFFTKFVEAGNMQMKAVGSVRDGAYVWALAQVGESFSIGGKSDSISSYILLSSPHIGGLSMRAQYMPTRDICTNTMVLPAALKAVTNLLPRSEGSMTRKEHMNRGKFRLPHSQLFSETLKTKAAEALGIATKEGDLMKRMGNLLAKTRIPDSQNLDLFYELMNVPSEKVKAILAGEEKKPLIIAKMEDALHKSPGAEMNSAKGTLWGWLNAVTYVVDHEQGRSADNRLFSAWFGEGNAIKGRALSNALALAEAA